MYITTSSFRPAPSPESGSAGVAPRRFAAGAAALFGALLLGLAAGCGGISKVPGLGDTTRFLPETDDVPGLERVRQPSTYRGGQNMVTHIGSQANVYVAYGADVVAVGEYTWDGKDRRLTAEAVKMVNPVSASGLFHRHRGTLGNRAVKVDVGAEGVVDGGRDKRNLYFYKNNIFCKLVYAGPAPIPDLLPVARKMAARIGGNDFRPEGYEYLSVEGVNMETAGVTPGYTMNMDFLPPSVAALAPGGGTPSSAAYVIVAANPKDAERMERDFRDYLRIKGRDNGEAKTDNGKRVVWWGADNSGPMIATRKNRTLVIVTNYQNRRVGGELMDRIVEKIKN